MKNRLSNTFIYMFITITMAALAGCIASSMNSPTTNSIPSTVSPFKQATVTFTPSPLHTNTPKPEPTFPPTPTPLPTLNKFQSDQMKTLLQSYDCKLPCYLGIIPGKTKLVEAEEILEGIGAKYQGSFPSKTENVTKYPYFMRIGSLNHLGQFQTTDGVSNTIFQDVTLISSGSIVEGMDISVTTSDLKEDFRKDWSMYSVKEILKLYGVPDQISLETTDPQMAYFGHKALLVYSKNGVVIEIYGNEDENSICTEPGYEARSLDLHIVLTDRNSTGKLYTQDGIPLTDEQVWTPISKVLHITNDDFYNKLIANPFHCFELK